MIKKYFTGSIIFTAIAIVIGFFLGAGPSMHIIWWLQVVFIVLILWILETSLSFDNAVVNATVLQKMSPKWQHRFLTRGIAIAVFGMRVIFPLIIVAIVWQIHPIAALTLAINDPSQYAHILTSAHYVIAGFGGAFLIMVAFNFFLDAEKQHHRIWPVEKTLQKIWSLESVGIVITLLILILVGNLIPAKDTLGFIGAGIRGLIVFVLVEWLAKLLDRQKDLMQNAAKIGLSLFLYLEVLDASFSFDGVIGAFALSKNIFIIALWLGIGAMFVRSLTIMLVRKWTLAKYAYLEHGAFRAIFALALIMFINTLYEVPEFITGLIGAALIWVALRSSIRMNKRLANNWKKEWI